MAIKSLFTAFWVAALALSTTAPAEAVGMRIRGTNTSLRLVRHDVHVRVTHPVVVVRLVQEFENPLSRQVEGDYSYHLPRGAHVDDLALWVNGVRRSARMMERQKAREIYQRIVSSKRDPALVERNGLGVYRVRIFPVLPKQRTRIELRYTMLSKALARGVYRVQLHRFGKTALRISGRFDRALHDIHVHGYRAPIEKAASGWVLPLGAAQQHVQKPVNVHYRVATKDSHSVVQQRGDTQYIVAEIDTLGRTKGQGKVAFLLDTSKSMKKHWPVVQRLVGALNQKRSGKAPQNDASQLLLIPLSLTPKARAVKDFDQIAVGGGSAFIPAYELALASGARRLVLITDGKSISYQAEIEHLARRLYDENRKKGQPATTISAVVVGDDTKLLSSIGHLVSVAPGGSLRRLQGADDAIFSKIEQAAQDTGGATPQIHSDEARIEIIEQRHRSVVVTFRSSSVHKTPRVVVEGGQPIRLHPRAMVHGPLTLWGARQIGRLEREIKLFGQEDELRPKIVSLSKRLRIASEYTALLVTETDAQYKLSTSGRKWQRRVRKMGDNVPGPINYHATPEPHEWAMLAIGLVMLFFWHRKRKQGGWSLGGFSGKLGA
jgi:hypothetical protein